MKHGKAQDLHSKVLENMHRQTEKIEYDLNRMEKEEKEPRGFFAEIRKALFG